MKKNIFRHTAVILSGGFLLATLMATATIAAQDVIYKKARPKTTEAQKKAKDEAEKSGEYVYTSEGKVDPFAAFVVKQEATFSQLQKAPESQQLQKMLALLADLKKPKTELQRIKIADLTLTAIVKTNGDTMAMVRGGEKGTGYMLKKGTFIGTNGGVVDKIISEEKKTELGPQVIKKVIVKEPYLDRDGKLKYKEVEMNMAGSVFD